MPDLFSSDLFAPDLPAPWWLPLSTLSVCLKRGDLWAARRHVGRFVSRYNSLWLAVFLLIGVLGA